MWRPASLIYKYYNHTRRLYLKKWADEKSMAQSRSSGGRRELGCGAGWPLFISDTFTYHSRAQRAPAQAHSHRLRCWRETAGGRLATWDQFFANKLLFLMTPLWSSLCWHSLASALPRKSPFPFILAKLMLIENLENLLENLGQNRVCLLAPEGGFGIFSM